MNDERSFREFVIKQAFPACSEIYVSVGGTGNYTWSTCEFDPDCPINTPIAKLYTNEVGEVDRMLEVVGMRWEYEPLALTVQVREAASRPRPN